MKLAVVVITDAATGRDLEPHCLSSIHGAISAGCGPFTDIEICINSYEAEDENKAALLNRVAIELAQGGFDWAFLMRSTELINQSVFEDAGPFLADYDAVWGQICEPIAEQGGQLGFRVGQAKTLTNFEDLLFRNPATTIGGGHFVRVTALLSTPYDEHLPLGESTKQAYALWRNFRCIKVERLFSSSLLDPAEDSEESVAERRALFEQHIIAQSDHLFSESRRSSDQVRPAFSLNRDGTPVPVEFVVVCPYIFKGSVGSEALHKLPEDLTDAGFRAVRVFLYQRAMDDFTFSLDGESWATLKRDTFDAIVPPATNRIVIHGENLDCKYFQSHNVARWYLNRMGVLRNKGRARDHEFRLAWDSVFVENPNFILRKSAVKGLDYFETVEYVPNSARCLDLTYIGKGANHRSDLKRLPQTLLLSRDWPNNDDEYLFLLSKTKHLFTYDPVSQVIHDAIAMGARPVLMTKSPLSSAQFVEMQGRLQGLISVYEESDHSDGKAFEQSRLDWLTGLQPLGTYNAPLEECVASMVSFFS